MTSPASQSGQSRRGFIAKSALATAATTMVHSSTARAQEKTVLKIAVVGCGGRGRGAVTDSLAINDNVKVVAVADLSEKNIDYLRRDIGRKYPDKLDVAEDRVYTGLDAYKRVLDDPDVDVVHFATPPGFRPYHIAEAVEAGKHVFAEKPTCVDPAGYRVCLAAHDKAVSQGTAIVTGTQYRRQVNFLGAVEQIRQGAIGDIVSAVSRYCSTGIWFKNRGENMTDAEYQIFNWMHHIWLSGDQIAEQAVHNIDTVNWVMDSAPVSAFGSGGRFTRPEGSEMWDSMCIDYEYPGNKIVSFMCRQIPGSKTDNDNVFYGTEGVCTIESFSGESRIVDRKGNKIWSMEGDIGAAYRQEHKDLIDSIRDDKPIVELKQTAESSLTAVLGRMAAYTGQKVTWDFVTKESQLDLFPKDLSYESELPAPAFAVPGTTKLI